jgi:hypothetical protein
MPKGELERLLEQTLAPERCVEMTLKALRAKSEPIARYYQAAAQFFALTAEEQCSKKT